MNQALVLGLGESGLAMARWLAREGWALRVADTRAEPPMLAALRAELPGADFVHGAAPPSWLEGVTLVAASPGLSPHAEPLRGLAAAAAAAGIAWVGEIELFARALAKLREEQGYAPAVLGITGTNGKTTTARMAGAMVAAAGRSVAVAGNISPAALDALREALDAGRLPEVWVLELSSFQLATTQSLRCTAATVLNITQDHLDWHPSFEDYAKCKLRLLAATDVAVVNRDDPQAQPVPARTAARDLVFGAAPPDRPGSFGLLREGGIAWLCSVDPDDTPQRRRRAPRPAAEAPVPPVDAEPLHVRRLMPVEALPVRGTHNALNALAALALVQAAGLPLAPALRALAQFRGEPHRTQPVATVAGVEYVDDSKGTNVGATLAALRGLGDAQQPGQRLVVLLGGEGKGQDFAPLAPALAAVARAAVLYGADAPRIADALRDLPLPVIRVAGLEDAVARAAQEARPGDAVLLSPACASFDAFRNYAHRAEVFAAAVRALAAAAAQSGEGA